MPNALMLKMAIPLCFLFVDFLVTLSKLTHAQNQKYFKNIIIYDIMLFILYLVRKMTYKFVWSTKKALKSRWDVFRGWMFLLIKFA